ncbi:uncharacterized protein LOC132959886 [Labrus mixtus]|uniref:uncharacterized protein LOC132959886 n=1 Tax=Labrus mixtus TaxID=508554 RepID=UPI0029C00251|nr:uncharacterized protein LOC132959886 [Labrus mixtus]
MSPVCVLLMFVCLQRGQVSTAVPEVQILNLKVEYGESAILPCNGSAYLGEKGIVNWETSMGKKVAILRFVEEKEWEMFEVQSEVQLPTDEQLHGGDWSLVLQPTMLRDSGTYECIWEGQRQAIMSTVWLTVNEPHIEDGLLCFEGETVTLKCYLSLSRSQNPSSLQVGWTKDRQTLVSTGEERTYPADDAHRFQISMISTEEYHLKISPTRLGDNGAYHCWYKTRDSESPRPGLPSIFHLSVLESTFKGIPMKGQRGFIL